MKKIFLINSAVLLCLFTLSAQAKDQPIEKKDYFFQVNLGYAEALNSTGTSTVNNGESINGSIGQTGVYGIELGKKFKDDFALSIGLDALPDFSKNVHGNQNARQIGVFTINTESNVLMLNGYYNLAKFGSFTPYLTAGVGYAENTTVQEEYTLILFSIPYSTNTTNNFAYKIGIGTKYSINDYFDLDIHYQYRDLGKYQTGTYIYNSRVYGGVRGDLKVNEVICGLSVKF